MKSEQEIQARLEELKTERDERMDITNNNHAVTKPVKQQIKTLEWVLEDDE